MTGTQGSRSHEETEGTQYVCGVQCGPGNQLLRPEYLFLPEARVHGHSVGTKHLCQRVFWEIIQTGDLTLDGDLPCVHGPVPLLGAQGDPAEVPGKKPQGRPSPALSPVATRGRCRAAGLHRQGEHCAERSQAQMADLQAGRHGGGRRGLLSSPGGRCRGGAGIRGEARSGALPRVCVSICPPHTPLSSPWTASPGKPKSRSMFLLDGSLSEGYFTEDTLLSQNSWRFTEK